jgi:hypothetical protein
MAKKRGPRRTERVPRTRSAASKIGLAPAAPSKSTAVTPEWPGFPVVGVGASAGGLEAFSQMLAVLAPDSGVAIVFVQHLSPNRDSMLAELLGNQSSIPVVQISDGMPIEANHVYVTPPNVQLDILNGQLRLVPRPSDLSQHTPVDHFFHSLAVAAQGHAIGVVLSGTASDGASGLKEIKAVGGIAIAQTPESAKFSGMPSAAMVTVEREVHDRQGGAYTLRIRPYKSLENRIDGAILVLFEVDALRRGDLSQQYPSAALESLIDGLDSPLVMLDPELRVKFVNQAFPSAHALKRESAVGRLLYELDGSRWDNKSLRAVLSDSWSSQSPARNVRLRLDPQGDGAGALRLNARPISSHDGRSGVLLVRLEEESTSSQGGVTGSRDALNASSVRAAQPDES